jgi:acyl-CoA thioesterase-1
MRFPKLLIMLFLLAGNSSASTLLVLGDSLSAGYGINPDNGWVNLLRADMEPHLKIINASISGDTTGNGLARLPLLLEKFKPTHVLLELGGNDGLRGHPLARTKSNLQTMIDLCRAQDAQPILFAMRLPPNYGKRYTDRFARLFPALAEEQDIPLVPFQFEKLVLTEGMIQQDGIHPTELAQPIIKQAVLTEVRKILE